MDKIVKVSIARFSFTLDENAHMLLENYLNNLKEYYIPLGEGDVVDGIEERIAELLMEMGGAQNVVTMAMIDRVIAVLGEPEDIENSTRADQKQKSRPKKRLFRDPQNKVFSGVCGGIAAYSGVDVVYVRIIFSILLLVMGVGLQYMVDGRFPGFLFAMIIYFALVMIIPKAVTVEQRCMMRGEAENVNQIRQNVIDREYVQREATSAFGEVLKVVGRVLAIFVGTILILLGVSGLVGGLFMFVGINIFSSESVWELVDLLYLNIDYPIFLKIAGLLVYFLPFIGFLYGGIMLCFSFKSPKWKPGITILLLWILSVILFIVLAASAFRPYYHHSSYTEELVMPKNYDTVYVSCPNVNGVENPEFYFDAGRRWLKTYYENESEKGSEWVIYPYIAIRDMQKYGVGGEYDKSTIEVEFNSFSKSENIYTTSKASDVVTVKDSLITLSPMIISKEHKFDGKYWEVKMHFPKETVVIVTQPKHYVFRRDN